MPRAAAGADVHDVTGVCTGRFPGVAEETLQVYEQIAQFVRWAIPPALHNEDPRYRDAARAVILDIAMMFWGPVFAPIYYWLGSPRGAIIILSGSFCLVLLLVVLRMTGSVRVVGNMITGVVFGVLIGLACVSGGIQAASLCWLPALPILALLICGPIDGIVWAVVSCLACAEFYWIGRMSIDLPNDIDPRAQEFLYFIGVCGIVLCAFVLTLMFTLGESLARRSVEAARDVSDRANEAKSQFLANMSHEIRTPMNAILGMTDLVLDTELSSEQRSYLGVARKASRSLLTLLDDILDFSKIEAGKLQLVHEPFNLPKLLGDTMKAVGFKTPRREVALLCDLDEQLPRYVTGDAGRLRQIILNLVDNGLKFTTQGEVALEARLGSVEGDRLELEFAVRDTGLGISPDKQQVIFEMFEQADMSTTRPFGGVGLGLSICSQLVTLMGGSIRVESELEEGSTFRFTARFGLCDDVGSSRATRDISLPKAIHALVATIHPAEQRLLARWLSEWQMTVSTPSDLAEFLRAVSESESTGVACDVMVVDQRCLDQPTMDTIQSLREVNRIAGPVIILVPPGEAWQPACTKIDRAAFLLVPTIPEELHAALANAWGLESADLEPPIPDGISVPQRLLRVLLVEDSLVNQRLTAAIVEKMGHEIVLADQGQQALSLYQTSRFDLILMDIQMPVLDGLQVTRMIREQELDTDQHVPIIALTAHALATDRQRCLDAGMDAYLSKPISAKALRQAIARLFGDSD